MIKLYSQNKHYKLYNGSMLDMLDVIDENSVDAIVTDPPYELGFMGKTWDSSGVAFQKETWEKCLKVLKPGGHILAFGGSRTFYRIACAIEDAGFEIRDTVMWLYGSGFPKSLNIGLAVDKKNGVESEVVGKGKSGVSSRAYQSEEMTTAGEYEIREACNKWSGWGTALKPSFEPIIVARKPFKGSLVDNVIENGVGGLNIDECRVGFENGETNSSINRYNSTPQRGNNGWEHKNRGANFNEDTKKSMQLGRFPANVIHDGSEEALESMPTTGSGNGGKPYNYAGKEYNNKDTSMFNGDKPQANSNYNDNGSAGRYFKACEYGEKDIESSGRFPANTILTYDETDFDEVCSGFPYTKSTGGSGEKSKSNTFANTYNDGWGHDKDCAHLGGLGDEGSASRYFYCAKASKKDREEGCEELEMKVLHRVNSGGLENEERFKPVPRKNIHPTVKPTELMQYLIRLVTPNGGTVLDPFNGSGSTGKAVMYENKERNKNYKYIGIELTEEYLPISKARIEYVCNLPKKVSLIDL